MPIDDDRMNRRHRVHTPTCSEWLFTAAATAAVSGACVAASFGAMLFVAPDRRVFSEYFIVENVVRSYIASLLALGGAAVAVWQSGALDAVATVRRDEPPLEHIVTLSVLGGRVHSELLGVESTTFGDAVDRARTQYVERRDRWRACRSTTRCSDDVVAGIVKRTQIVYLGEARKRDYPIYGVLVVGEFDECLGVARHLDRIPAGHAIWYCYVAPLQETSDELEWSDEATADAVRDVYRRNEYRLVREVRGVQVANGEDEESEGDDESEEVEDEESEEEEEGNEDEESDEELSTSSNTCDSPAPEKTDNEE